uniref:NFACT RNA-binding domain-containing protein n=1 Tax=viral metagenome TaxID=1070528 RepID=A0A6C0AS85_9ZZZZ
MKTENVYINALKKEIVFYIGQNQTENFEIIDKCTINDLWFHANNISSCHVVCKLPDKFSKKEMHYIIKVDALLCKNNTNKLKSIKNVEIMYTYIKNIVKTELPGCVISQNTKTIIC